MALRKAIGSWPAAWAISSMKLSRKKVFCEAPTLRQKVTGTWVLRTAAPTDWAGIS